MAKCYVVLNSDGSIHTVGEKNIFALESGQVLREENEEIAAFVNSLPEEPKKCMWTGVSYAINPDYEDPVIYSPNDLILWAMQEYPEFIGTPHEYVLSTFANNPVEYKDLMVSRAAIVDAATGNSDLTDVATALIAKAIQLGASIS